ncbi:retrovirus-related pol polyprotein from transposon TNT 1-94 [Tanacetum coccineum]
MCRSYIPYRGLYRDRRLSISGEALGAFGKGQTYSAEDTDTGQKDRIMDSDALFHATYCKEELERFKLHSGKIRLADDKTLDIADVGDVVLKTSFGTSWTLKDVRYILGLKRRLISVGQLDEEGYHVGFGDQQWKVTKGSLVVARGNKRGSLFMVEDWWNREAKESFLHNVSEDKETTEVGATGVAFGVAERLSQTFRAESTGIRVEVSKMLWADSVSTTYLIYCIPYVPIGLRIPEEEWRGKDTSLTHLKAVAQMKCDTAFEIRRVTRLSEAEILHLRTRFMEPENDSIDAEHVLSSEITQSPGGSSDTSEGSENSGSFEDSRRSDEEYSEDGASSKEGGSETLQVRRSTRESRAPVRCFADDAMKCTFIKRGSDEIDDTAFGIRRVTRLSEAEILHLRTRFMEPENDSIDAEHVLSSEITQSPDPSKEGALRIHRLEDFLQRVQGSSKKKASIEEMVSLEKNQTCSLVRISAGKKASKRLWMFKIKEEQNSSEKEPSYVGALNDTSTQHKSEGFQLAGQEENLECRLKEIMYGLIQAPMLRYLKFDSFMQKDKNEEPCRDVHQVGDEREVEVLRNFNWPLSELITEYGVLPKRGYSHFNDVSSGYLVSKVS